MRVFLIQFYYDTRFDIQNLGRLFWRFLFLSLANILYLILDSLEDRFSFFATQFCDGWLPARVLSSCSKIDPLDLNFWSSCFDGSYLFFTTRCEPQSDNFVFFLHNPHPTTQFGMKLFVAIEGG